MKQLSNMLWRPYIISAILLKPFIFNYLLMSILRKEHLWEDKCLTIHGADPLPRAEDY